MAIPWGSLLTVSLNEQMELISIHNVNNEIPENTIGVYHIIGLDKNGEVSKINRCLGNDDKGIIYIGKAVDLQRRLTNFKKAIFPKWKSQGHIAARRYNKIPLFQSKFPPERIAVRIEIFGSDQAAKEAERNALDSYVLRYGDNPPLNRQ